MSEWHHDVMAQAEKRTTTVRLNPVIKDRLDKAAFVLKRSQNQIIEEALQEYFEHRGLVERYQVTMTKDHVVLIKLNKDQATVVEVTPRNGVPPNQVAENYATKLQRPVDLVGVEGETS